MSYLIIVTFFPIHDFGRYTTPPVPDFPTSFSRILEESIGSSVISTIYFYLYSIRVYIDFFYFYIFFHGNY